MIGPTPPYPPILLVVSALSAGAGTLMQSGAGAVTSMDPASPVWWYREFGAFGLMLFAAYLMLRYFMTKVSEKDLLIKDLTDQHRASTDRNTEVLLTHLREGFSVQQEIARSHQESADKTAMALNRLSAAIERAGDLQDEADEEEEGGSGRSRPGHRRR